MSPAGTGKTSLLASWVAASDRPIAWLTVDDTDHDATQLWTGVIAALEPLVHVGLARAMTLLQRPRSLEAAVAALLDDLETLDRPNSTLLLDDAHLVDDNAEAVASLALFIQHLPPWLQVVLTARRTPQLPLARMRARGELGEVRFADLMFSADEAAELLRSLTPGIDDEQLRNVVDRTGGWAAGIRLAALATRSTQIQGQEAPADRESLLVSEYMWREVLTAEAPELVDVLLDISPVERVSKSLAERLTGSADAGQLLAVAESRGLFVSRLGSTDWFEVHALVRERLRAELATSSPAHLAELHTRAAGWFEETGEVAMALDHWILADQAGNALRLLATKSTALYDSGREATIARALARIPLTAAQGDVQTAIDLAWCFLLVDRTKFVREVDHATSHARRVSKPDPIIQAQLTMLQAISATIQGDWSNGGRLAQRAITDLGDGCAHDLVGRFGWNMVAREIALSERWQESTEVEVVQHELSGDLERRLAFEGTRALGEALAGHPLDALRVAAGVRQAASVASMSILRMELAAAEAIAHREVGDHSLAQVELASLAADSSGPVAYAALLARLELTQLHLDEGHLAEAEADFGRAVDLVEYEVGGPGGRDWLGRVGTLIELARGDLDRARSWSATIVDTFWGPISRARTHRAAGENSEARDALDEAVARCVRHEVVQDLIRAQVSARPDDSLEQIGLAVERAAARGLVQTVASEGQACIRLVELVAWRVPESWMNHVRRAPSGIATDGVQARHRVEHLTDRERDVLRLLPSRLTLHEIADELFISTNTLKFHLKVIYRKLYCSSRAEAAAIARDAPPLPGWNQLPAITRR